MFSNAEARHRLSYRVPGMLHKVSCLAPWTAQTTKAVQHIQTMVFPSLFPTTVRTLTFTNRYAPPIGRQLFSPSKRASDTPVDQSVSCKPI